MKYEYISYDVWGNENDGYEVNQAFHTGESVDIDPYLSDNDLLNQLASQGFILEGIDYDQVSIDGEPEFSLYFEYKGRPEFELRPVEEETA